MTSGRDQAHHQPHRGLSHPFELQGVVELTVLTLVVRLFLLSDFQEGSIDARFESGIGHDRDLPGLTQADTGGHVEDVEQPVQHVAGIQAASFHPQRLRLGLDPEPPRLQLPIEAWTEFCATAKALGVVVVFYEAEPFAGMDLPVGTGQRRLWDVLPEAAWLERQVGEIPTASYYAFFVGGMLKFQQDTAWWNRTEGLWEKAEEAVKHRDQQQRQQAWEAFVADMQQVSPQDEAFRRIALLPRPPITALRQRIAELFPRQHVVAGLNVTLHELVRQIKAEEKAKNLFHDPWLG